MESLRELIEYYKSVFTMLSTQAMEQAKGMVRLDYHLLERLFEILIGNTKKCDIRIVTTAGNPYAEVFVKQYESPYDSRQINDFFSATTVDVNYLVARQIAREVGDITNLRGCGLSSAGGPDGSAIITVVLPVAVVKKIDFEGLKERWKHKVEMEITEVQHEKPQAGVE